MRQRIQAAQEFLLRVQHQDGGWPYRVGAQPYPEPTCYSLLALQSSDAQPPVTSRDRGVAWLEAHVNASGAVTLDQDDEPHWSTSLLVITLTRLGRATALSARCVKWLLSWQGNQSEPQAAVSLNSQLRGWPWISDTFSWVEPTSWSLLALKLSGYSDHPRVVEAERLLLDRTCVDGGWNYGNPAVFGRALPPFIPTTAVAALALQGVPTASRIVDQALAFLRREASRNQSTLSLALTLLSLNAFGRPTDAFTEPLLGRQQPDGSWRGAVHLTALAILALTSLTGGANVFKL